MTERDRWWETERDRKVVRERYRQEDSKSDRKIVGERETESWLLRVFSDIAV